MQQGVARDEVERIRLAQAQQDGQRQVEAPLRLVQLRQRLQQRRAVAAGGRAPCAAARTGSSMDRRRKE